MKERSEKFWLERDSTMLAQCSFSCSIRPTGNWSLHGSMISLLIVDICDQMQINESSFELQMETILMLMIFPVLLTSAMQDSSLVQAKNFQASLTLSLISSIAKQLRALTLKLFPSTVQMKLY